MKRITILAMGTILLALFAGVGTLTAQQGGGPGWGRGPGMMGPGEHGRGWGWGHGMMGPGWGYGPGGMGMGCPMIAFGDDGETTTFIDGRIAFLKTELKITDAQKDVWEGYENALKNNLQTMTSMHQLMQTAFEAKTPVERLDTHLAAMETRLNALKEMQPALSKLYDALDDSQREKANELLTTMGCMM